MRCQQTGEKYEVKQMNTLQYNIFWGKARKHTWACAGQHLSKIQLQPFLFLLFVFYCVLL